MRLLRWLFLLFALMYAPAQAAEPNTPPVVPPSAGQPNGAPNKPTEPSPRLPGVDYPSPGSPGKYLEPTEAEKDAVKAEEAATEAERQRLVERNSRPINFPEASAVNIKSVCQTNRDKTFGNNTEIFNPGKTMESATAIYNALPCPTTWLAQTVKAISDAGLPGYISKLAFAVWFLGIIWTGVRIANGSEKSDGRELFARLLISGWLVFGSATTSAQLSEPKFTGNMGQFVRAAWVQAYTWGDSTFATPALKRAAEQTANLGEHISRLVTLYASAQVLSEAVKEGVKGAAVSTVTTGNPITGGIVGMLMGGAGAAGNVVAATTQAGILAVNMVMPILLTYYLIITGTGLAAVIASMLLPLVGAMFVFGTGLGMQYAETWFRTVASAVLMMALMPVFFTASLELGFVEPARNFDRYTTRAQVSLQADFDKLTKLAKEDRIGGVEENLKKLENILQAFFNKFDVVGYLNSMLTSLVLMAFSLIAGMYTLRIAQNWIIEFLSGVASAITGGGGAPSFGKAIGAGAGAAGSAASTGARVASNSASKTGGAQATASVPKSAPSGNSPKMASAGSGAGVKPGAGATNGSTPSTVGGNAPQQSAQKVGGGGGSSGGSKATGYGFGTSTLASNSGGNQGLRSSVGDARMAQAGSGSAGIKQPDKA